MEQADELSQVWITAFPQPFRQHVGLRRVVEGADRHFVVCDLDCHGPDVNVLHPMPPELSRGFPFSHCSRVLSGLC
jgi:hypothetical protein